MRDFWVTVPLAAIALAGFFIYGIGQVIFADMEKSQLRYEQCIAADRQWVKGICVK